MGWLKSLVRRPRGPALGVFPIEIDKMAGAPSAPQEADAVAGQHRWTAHQGEKPEALADTVRACRLCLEAPRRSALPHQPRPILCASGRARLAIASQAPGIRAHVSGIPFADPSGERLREWLGIGPRLFYDPARVAIVPMAFCFPGHDSQKGDLPPRSECRAAWHDRIFAAMPQVETILAVGLHAIRYHVARLYPDAVRTLGLTDQVAAWRELADRTGPVRLIPLPHPSWRNSGWLKRHPWFEAELLPVVRAEVRRLVGCD